MLLDTPRRVYTIRASARTERMIETTYLGLGLFILYAHAVIFFWCWCSETFTVMIKRTPATNRNVGKSPSWPSLSSAIQLYLIKAGKCPTKQLNKNNIGKSAPVTQVQKYHFNQGEHRVAIAEKKVSLPMNKRQCQTTGIFSQEKGRYIYRNIYVYCLEGSLFPR